jgi:hypothetical protein
MTFWPLGKVFANERGRTTLKAWHLSMRCRSE